MQGRQVTREDLKKAIERNLHLWSRWRTLVNDRLIEGNMNNHGEMPFIPNLDDIINSRTPYDSEHDLHVNDPMSLLAYAPKGQSHLPPFVFLCYGLPRAKINRPKLEDYSLEDELDDIYAGYPFLPYKS